MFHIRTLIKSLYTNFDSNSRLRRDIISITGLRPRNIKLYISALTHRSIASKQHNGSDRDNERLEYLGDAVLSAVIADYLFKRYPGSKEGFLTKMRSRLVNRENLNRIALSMKIDKLVMLNRNGVPTKKFIYGNALEALIGAIYIDRGYKNARKFITGQIISSQAIDKLEGSEWDYKSRIIQWGQKNKQEISFESYELDKSGNPEPLFVATIHIMDTVAGEGFGCTKKEAQQLAARKALENLPS